MFDKKRLLEATQKALMELIDSDEFASPSIEKMVKEKPEAEEKPKFMEMLKMMGMVGKESPEEEEMEEKLEGPEMHLGEDEMEDEDMGPEAKRKKAIMLAVMKK